MKNINRAVIRTALALLAGGVLSAVAGQAMARLRRPSLWPCRQPIRFPKIRCAWRGGVPAAPDRRPAGQGHGPGAAASGGRAPECVSPDPFLPPGASPWGRISVGVRCGGERPWVRYMQARVSVLSDYYVAVRAFGPGEPVTPADLEVRQGDLSTLPRAVITDPSQVVGAVTANRIAAGSPMRTDLLKKSIAVRSGQTVTVAVEGDAFQITSEGKVLADAAIGNPVQIRLRNGQVVSGLVRSGDTVVLQ